MANPVNSAEVLNVSDEDIPEMEVS